MVDVHFSPPNVLMICLACFLFSSTTFQPCFGVPFDLPKHAGQDSHVSFFQSGAPENAPERKQHVLRILRVKKTDF